ncbi:MAG: PSD1 and planctomycete cytochrome C domain-containing protein [Phycisphaerae bacterium]
MRLLNSALSIAMLAAAVALADGPSYDRDVRPILSDRCFKCHGPDAGTRQAGLRLDEFAAATGERDSVWAIAPGRVAESEVWRRINSRDPAVMMPPSDSSKRPLSVDELRTIHDWIEAGAAYEPHWSFVPPVRRSPPTNRTVGWSKNPIDEFILSTLEERGIRPSPPAELPTLIRRVTLDLTGLPPTVDELSAIPQAGAQSADAAQSTALKAAQYDAWVETLLTKEPYRSRVAERMATPWLDAARYADTCGIHLDAGRQMWMYRDWVLAAFRDNLPFDRFVVEQLAGDLVPDATLNQKVASGFNRCHVTTDEGGAIPEEYLVEYAVDRAATTGSVFLGLTVGCARCHDHKFDPISQSEFYSLYAYFNSIDEPGLYSQLPDVNRAFEPFIQVPSAEDESRIAALQVELAAAKKLMEQTTPEDALRWDQFQRELPTRSGIAWRDFSLVSATSTGGATMTPQADGSILVGGENPATDEHMITLRTTATDSRLIALEALADPAFVNGRVGRADNGNAVLSGIEVEAISIREPSQRRAVRVIWGWADFEQANGDFRVVNVLDSSDHLGWAVNAHDREGPRAALLLADAPFGFEGGTEVRVTLQYRSNYAQHAFGRVRVSLASIGDGGLDALPAAASGWYTVGPFPLEATREPYQQSFEPESDVQIDLKRNFGAGNQMWRFVETFVDDRVNALPDGRNVTYVARRIFAPTPRTVELSLGSDDGFQLFLNGKQVAARKVERGAAPDQDKATIELHTGLNVLVFKIINTGGQAGFYYRAQSRAHELAGPLAAALLPKYARWPELISRVQLGWKFEYSPDHRARREVLSGLEKKLAEANAAIPQTMVMKELPTPRETFVLTRGEYDKPDKARPVRRGIPAALGHLPDDAPNNRLGLAQWLVSPGNPLLARVTVNRLWEQFFGTGLVSTSEDFGMQSAWPSHPELLDWLAVEFRESGWDMRHIVRLIVSSATYQQDSRIRPDIRERDPTNQWLTHFPRRRHSAEIIRDQALFLSGLLVERFGGPSARPYQPDGLWQEISMPQSNTRIFERDKGDGLWRRSLYTYWKRACPPPSLMAFDAPTRESCTVRRLNTNTPLQALVLWNDEQFVEAARKLAERAIHAAATDAERLTWLHHACAGRKPEPQELAALAASLRAFRASYSLAPDEAAKLLNVGEAPAAPEIEPIELAAWTMVASAALNLDLVLSQN